MVPPPETRSTQLLVLEAVIFTALSVIAIPTVSILRSTQRASPDAGGMAAIGAFMGLIGLALVVGLGVVTLLGTNIYRRRKRRRTVIVGPALVGGGCVLLVPVVGIYAVGLWPIGTALYFWGLVIRAGSRSPNWGVNQSPPRGRDRPAPSRHHGNRRVGRPHGRQRGHQGHRQRGRQRKPERLRQSAPIHSHGTRLRRRGRRQPRHRRRR